MQTRITVRSAHSTPVLLLGALLALLGCRGSESAQEPPPPPRARSAERARLSSEFAATAEVVALDPAERLVTLRREDGSSFRVKAGEEVRNFAQIAVGDKLRLRYKETLVAALLPPGADPGHAEAALAAARAEPGEKPGAGVGSGFSLRVRIESLDREHEIVVFSLPTGELLARRVVTAEGRDFVEGVKIGDLVQLTYTEALVLSIEEL
jgi:hypothetical protein